MHSDNGTNFIGAASELKDALKTTDWSKVNRYCCEQEIDFQWIFTLPPPSFSPWMEGGWKSLIKSVKRAMKAITLIEYLPMKLYIPSFVKPNALLVNVY